MFSKIKKNHLCFVCNRPNLSAKHSCSSENQYDTKHRRLLYLKQLLGRLWDSSVLTPPEPVYLQLKMMTRAQQDSKLSLARVGLNALRSADKGHEYDGAFASPGSGQMPLGLILSQHNLS